MYGVYVHIPFCVQKCSYCDFLSFEDCSKQDDYVDALLKEIAGTTLPEIDTIYIGGGTPTALPSFLLQRILSGLPLQGDSPFTPTRKIIEKNTQFYSESHCVQKPLAEMPPRIEVTVEANPGTLNRTYLEALKASGVNRLSLGLQTTKPHLLKAINRLHSMEEFLENYHAAREVGFDNISVDLMFALPNQTLQDWQETLEAVIALKPEHISCYSLTLEEGTPLYDVLFVKGDYMLPNEATDRVMYHMAREMLQAAGYKHYELSNFAKPGYESRHNVNCWRRVPYRGFGLGAASFDGAKRWRNISDMAEYIGGNNMPQDIEVLTPADHDTETMILGLRLLDGIAEADVPPAYKGIVTAQIKKGLLTLDNGNVKLTPKGLDLANQVFMDFV